MAEYTLNLTQSESLEFTTDHTEDTDEAEATEPIPTSTSTLTDHFEAGDCPWCDYEGDHPQQHAAHAHEDNWTVYKEDRDRNG